MKFGQPVNLNGKSNLYFRKEIDFQKFHTSVSEIHPTKLHLVDQLNNSLRTTMNFYLENSY